MDIDYINDPLKVQAKKHDLKVSNLKSWEIEMIFSIMRIQSEFCS